MTAPNDYQHVVAELVELDQGVFQGQTVYHLQFVGENQHSYSKIINSNPRLGWKEVYKALGVNENKYSSLTGALGHKVELVLQGEEVRYINSLSPEQMYLRASLVKLTWWDNLKKWLANALR